MSKVQIMRNRTPVDHYSVRGEISTLAAATVLARQLGLTTVEAVRYTVHRSGQTGVDIEHIAIG